MTFLNTGLLYSEALCETIYEIGFNAALIEGKIALSNKKNQYTIYRNNKATPLTLIPINQSLSDDIAYRFSQKIGVNGRLPQISMSTG